MTMDVKARATALRLIAKFGKGVTYTSVSDGTYSPDTGSVTPSETPSSIKALISAYDKHGDGFASGAVRESDRKVMFAASGLTFTPKQGDKVTIDSDVFTVLDVKQIYSGELVAIYELHGRKS